MQLMCSLSMRFKVFVSFNMISSASIRTAKLVDCNLRTIKYLINVYESTPHDFEKIY